MRKRHYRVYKYQKWWAVFDHSPGVKGTQASGWPCMLRKTKKAAQSEARKLTAERARYMRKTNSARTRKADPAETNP